MWPNMFMGWGNGGLAFLPILMLPLLLWSIVWKGLALWRAARRGEQYWFVALLVINTLGILEILYLFVFTKDEKTPPPTAQWRAGNPMTWLLLVLAGHLANAGAFVVDKILLSKTLKYPTVYVFFIGLLGVLSFCLLPFADFHLLPSGSLILSAGAGISFMLALLCFFTALARGSASQVVPFIGALIPVWTLGFAAGMLDEALAPMQLIGVALLVLGAFLISYEDHPATARLSNMVYVVLAAGLFAFSYTLSKSLFNTEGFLNAFLWTRLFAFGSVLPLLALPKTRRAIVGGGGGRPTPLFFVGQAMGAAGFFLLNVGLAYAPRVSVVNALQGIQYAFLFLLVIIISWLNPRLLRETFTPSQFVRKLVALALLAGGLALAV